MLRVAGPESTSACQDEQLCGGLMSGIDGAVHEVQAIWDTMLTMEYWEFLLVDTKNAFNEINQIIILWTVVHL